MKRNLNIKFCKTCDMPEISYGLKMCIRTAIMETLEFEKFKFDAEVSVTFCDNKHIHKLNLQHRGINRETDVLSFPMYEDGDFVLAECISGAWLGDVVISLEKVKSQAIEYGNTFIREACFLTVHSILHLLGYDHERSQEDDEIQCKKQREIMKNLEKKVNLND